MRNDSSGYALIVVLVLMAASAFIISGALDLSSTSARTTYAEKVRTNTFYEAEEGMNVALSWLRYRSQDILSPFKRENFYTTFTRSASPALGQNDGSAISVPTRLKVSGTSNSVILASASGMGTSAYPQTQNLSTNASFNPISSFGSLSFGSSLVRLTVVDALPVDPTLDFGPPPAAAPQTDFYPVFRVDSMTNLTEKARVLGYIVGSMSYSDTIGFYGHDYMIAMQTCDSYISANGAYSAATKRARCPIGSGTQISVHQNTKIYGSARTNGGISQNNPYGGDICSDFVSGCPNKGTSCAGTSCGVPGLPSFDTWATYCPTTQGNRTVSSNQTWTVGGNAPSQKCWQNVTVNTNRTLTLTTTAYPYFIDNLSFANNSNSRLNIQPDSANGTVTLYVRRFSGDMVNGNQMFNTNNRPSQFKVYYLGTTDLTINGNANVNMALVAPYANVTVSGNGEFSGGIIAKGLNFTGSGAVHYDESLGGSTLTDATFKVRNEMQYYN